MPRRPRRAPPTRRHATALYDYAAGKWVNGPAIPTIGGMQYDSADGPGSILPDGNVLFDVSPCVYNAPIAFFLYNAELEHSEPGPECPERRQRLHVLHPDAGAAERAGAVQRRQQPDGGLHRRRNAQPGLGAVDHIDQHHDLTPGRTASLSGTQLAGLAQGAAYGDDVQDNTNFPLVRITNSKSGVVTYARTSNWTSVSIAPGAASSTDFTDPDDDAGRGEHPRRGRERDRSAPVPVTIR